MINTQTIKVIMKKILNVPFRKTIKIKKLEILIMLPHNYVKEVLLKEEGAQKQILKICQQERNLNLKFLGGHTLGIH